MVETFKNNMSLPLTLEASMKIDISYLKPTSPLSLKKFLGVDFAIKLTLGKEVFPLLEESPCIKNRQFFPHTFFCYFTILRASLQTSL